MLISRLFWKSIRGRLASNHISAYEQSSSPSYITCKTQIG